MEENKTGLELIHQFFNDFTPRQNEQLAGLEPLYRTWNEKINVISRKDIDALYERHILHSLAIAAIYHFKPGQQVLDLGTGGGFPGIPLAIYFPETQFLLADSINKKLKVVEAVAAATGLTNVTIQHTRAEEITNRKFHFVVSRAVAPLGSLWKWSKPLLVKDPAASIITEKPALICLKGGNLAEEISASGVKPAVWEINRLFPLPYFEEKYMLSVFR
jgi:16S rRNA (guanine527-N7)-methyltransferase